MKEINRHAFRGVTWAGKATLFCLGVLAMLALVIVATVLPAVMFAATTLPRAAIRRRRDPRGRRDSGNVSKLSAPRKAVAS